CSNGKKPDKNRFHQDVSAQEIHSSILLIATITIPTIIMRILDTNPNRGSIRSNQTKNDHFIPTKLSVRAVKPRIKSIKPMVVIMSFLVIMQNN
ncbi:MAG: hypothetical protein OEQ53_01560, partial [Saprospiraceae bacterium]|nr:hypothetical protein [Saprospiraceae bacterium]